MFKLNILRNVLYSSGEVGYEPSQAKARSNICATGRNFETFLGNLSGNPLDLLEICRKYLILGHSLERWRMLQLYRRSFLSGKDVNVEFDL